MEMYDDTGVMRKLLRGPLQADDWAVYLDMDGTIADFYGVPNWKSHLDNMKSTPYRAAEPLLDMSHLVLFLESLRAAGYKLGVSSWFAKNHSPEYDVRVADAKLKWLSAYLPDMDEVLITPYGSPKHDFVIPEAAVLFDDDEGVRRAWEASGTKRIALPENAILEERLRKETERSLISSILEKDLKWSYSEVPPKS